jgi:hypothetical protein
VIQNDSKGMWNTVRFEANVVLTLSLREENIMKVSEDKVLRKVFGNRGEEITDKWGKLHNEELHNFYSSPVVKRVIKSRKMICAGHIARMRR